MQKIFLVFVFLCMLPSIVRADPDVFDRVIQTKTIRCGYPIWAPSLMMDPNTKKLSGYSYDILNAVAEKLGLKLDWVEETGWGVAEQGIKTGRYDMVCADVCTDTARTRNIWYSAPFSVTPIVPFVREDNHRFDTGFDAINNPDVKLAIIGNTIFDYAARDNFPKAHIFDITELGGDIDVMMAVATRKADVGFTTTSTLDRYNNQSKDVKFKVVGTKPVRLCYGAAMLPQGDVRFKYMIDSAIHELAETGKLKYFVSKYMGDGQKYWMSPTFPYQPRNN